ncbi:MAG: hypothetical protein PF436_10820 [Prolixibacteraceae bacterium]|nr:hypothetical protein [Prolixibacteraceae bacterium]
MNVVISLLYMGFIPCYICATALSGLGFDCRIPHIHRATPHAIATAPLGQRVRW